jgi:metal-responsive CopG/Arc/MetJ family transcriptional regulator
MLADLDWLVARCSYTSRTEAMREAIAQAIAAERRHETDERIVTAYTRQPQTDDDLAGVGAQAWRLDDDDDWSGLDAPG